MPRYPPPFQERERANPDFGAQADNPNPVPDDMTEAERIIHILDYMKAKQLGFRSLRAFLLAVFTSEDENVKNRIGKFYQYGGFKSLFGLMLRHQKFAPNRRIMLRTSKDLVEAIGEELCDLFIRILRFEMGLISEEPRCRKAPTDVTPADCDEFSYQAFEAIYDEKAPLLSRIVKTLCCVPEELEKGKRGAFDPEYVVEELEQEEEEEEGSGSSDSDDSDSEFSGLAHLFSHNRDSVKHKTGSRRTTRNKRIVATCIISQMSFSRSRKINGCQVICANPIEGVCRGLTYGVCRQCLASICKALKSPSVPLVY